jgi:hypothetical protein
VIGLAVGLVGFLAALVAVWAHRRRRRDREVWASEFSRRGGVLRTFSGYDRAMQARAIARREALEAEEARWRVTASGPWGFELETLKTPGRIVPLKVPPGGMAHATAEVRPCGVCSRLGCICSHRWGAECRCLAGLPAFTDVRP